MNQTPPVSEVDKHRPFALRVWEKAIGHAPKREHSANDRSLQRDAKLNHIEVVALVTHSHAGFAVPIEDGAVTKESKDRQAAQHGRRFHVSKISK